ncbi:hypothetical protein DPMN_066821 [Dreissena polymorpha]|uniref:Uncharacterized protein n=1 Tax=Dreissena polymorpha TaxID=45954 RepID=A0A9D3YU81_DREPO|nr:hypothetical protein DPMN_066821 [Dreissena polymorpha]
MSQQDEQIGKLMKEKKALENTVKKTQDALKAEKEGSIKKNLFLYTSLSKRPLNSLPLLLFYLNVLIYAAPFDQYSSIF